MKIIIAVLSIALLAAIGFGVSQKNKSDALVGQLGSAQSQATKQIDDLKNSLASTNSAFAAQTENLQSQITAANDYAQQVQSKLDAASAQIAKLAPEAARARTLPLYVTWRRALTGNGKVLQVHNTSGEPLRLVIEAGNTAVGVKTFNRVASEKIPLEIGVLEGWDFAPGDKVRIASAGFDTQVFNYQ